jgi:hypothetical protein
MAPDADVAEAVAYGKRAKFYPLSQAANVHHGRAPPHFHGDEESHGYDCARARRAFADRAMRKWQTSCQRQ